MARGGFPALLYAAREGDVETAQVMLEKGVDINYGDVDNTTALTVSILNKQYSFAKFLLDRGADPEHRRRERTDSALCDCRSSQRGLDRASRAQDRRSAAEYRSREGPLARKADP